MSNTLIRAFSLIGETTTGIVRIDKLIKTIDTRHKIHSSSPIGLYKLFISLFKESLE